MVNELDYWKARLAQARYEYDRFAIRVLSGLPLNEIPEYIIIREKCLLHRVRDIEKQVTNLQSRNIRLMES